MNLPKGQSIKLRIVPIPSFRNVHPAGAGWYGFNWLNGCWKRIEHREDCITSTYLSDADLQNLAEDAMKSLLKKP